VLCSPAASTHNNHFFTQRRPREGRREGSAHRCQLIFSCFLFLLFLVKVQSYAVLVLLVRRVTFGQLVRMHVMSTSAAPFCLRDGARPLRFAAFFSPSRRRRSSSSSSRRNHSSGSVLGPVIHCHSRGGLRRRHLLSSRKRDSETDRQAKRQRTQRRGEIGVLDYRLVMGALCVEEAVCVSV